MQEIERYRIFSFRFESVGDGYAIFRKGERRIQVKGFVDGAQTCIRFMPDEEGEWQYEGKCGRHTVAGQFICTATKADNNGRVHVAGQHFSYESGKKFLPFGTTCYAWIYQPSEVIESTLKSLHSAPFNKIRMCIFPKYMAFNTEEPTRFPFHKDEAGNWDISSPDTAFWEQLETLICRLDDLGIEAELILFHPYDKWGFATLSREQTLAYIEYCVRRLSAYKNVWWSLANEYDLLTDKTQEDWDEIGKKVKEEDIYGHPVSIHDFCAIYPKKDWMSHLSVQSGYTSRTILWRAKYRLPVIVDEIGYEGNLPFGWGNLSAREYVQRMWSAIAGGGYCTHGETFYNELERIWWAKGGSLRGEALPRIRFLRLLLEEMSDPIDPMISSFTPDPNAKIEGQFTAFGKAMQLLSEPERELTIVDMIPPVVGGKQERLFWLGRGCPAWADIWLPSEGSFRIEVIDSWNMTRTFVCETDKPCRIPLPAREGMAVFCKKI